VGKASEKRQNVYIYGNTCLCVWVGGFFFRQHEATGEVREDPYYWFRDDERKDPDVIAHLESETKYCKAALADTEELQEELCAPQRPSHRRSPTSPNI
jgi:protease II